MIIQTRLRMVQAMALAATVMALQNRTAGTF
jgi:hypothetical protein